MLPGGAAPSPTPTPYGSGGFLQRLNPQSVKALTGFANGQYSDNFVQQLVALLRGGVNPGGNLINPGGDLMIPAGDLSGHLGAPGPAQGTFAPRGVANDLSVVPQFHPAQHPAGVAGPGARDAAHARAAQVARDAAAKAHAVHLLPMLIEHLRNSVY